MRGTEELLTRLEFRIANPAAGRVDGISAARDWELARGKIEWLLYLYRDTLATAMETQAALAQAEAKLEEIRKIL